MSRQAPRAGHGPLAPGPVSWRTHGTCPVDGDGDGVGDVASMVWSSRHKDRPTVVSGKDGRILWQGPSMKQNTPFYCVSRRWFAVEHAGFRLVLYPARGPRWPVEIKLHDKLEYLAAGTGCVKLKTADGRVTGYGLPEGKPGPCRTGKLRRARLMSHGVIQRHMKRGAVVRDGTRYEVRMRPQGTPMLTVVARRGRRRLWSKELPVQATSYGTAIAVAADRVLVFGVRPTRDKQGMLIALDAATGAQKYAQDLHHQSSQALAFFQFNGRYVVLAAWVGLHAFDPATGERVWSIGR